MLLRPRKFKYKNIFKRRTLRFSKSKRGNRLTYGSSGLLLLQPLRLNNKQIFRLKLLVKKGSKKSDITKRKVWFNIFPHIPLSRKVTGSRMGKGVGKLSGWITEIPSGVFLFEYRNLRPGRFNYYFDQVSARLPVRVRVVNPNFTKKSLILSPSVKVSGLSFW